MAWAVPKRRGVGSFGCAGSTMDRVPSTGRSLEGLEDAGGGGVCIMCGWPKGVTCSEASPDLAEAEALGCRGTVRRKEDERLVGVIGNDGVEKDGDPACSGGKVQVLSTSDWRSEEVWLCTRGLGVCMAS